MEPVSDWDSPEEILSRANDDVDRVAPLTYRDALRTVIKQRDDLQAKLDAELPAAWREDLASLNECLDRVSKERDNKNGQRIAAEHRAMAAERERDELKSKIEQERRTSADMEWQIGRIEEEIKRAGMVLQWTDGGGSKAPSGWARNPFLNYGDAAKERDLAIRERDELKARLAHAEADAEQAIHNEAFTERQRIVAWIRGQHARGSHDCSLSLMALDALRVVADEIERGEHREDGMIHERRP